MIDKRLQLAQADVAVLVGVDTFNKLNIENLMESFGIILN